MDTPSLENSSKSTPNSLNKGPFYQLQVVVSVAFVVATLFTAWTPASLLPGNLTKKLSEALAPISITPIPESVTPTPRPKPMIGIVVGHWDDNNDPGAVCPDGLTEFEVNQSIATLVMNILVENDIDVDLLKEFDYRLNGYSAIALVSIHADSCEYINDDATGFKVAAALSNPYPERAERLTACLRDRYFNATGLAFHSGSVTPDMSSYHAFEEVNQETTAAIIETGFLNLDRQILTTQEELVAEGIANGILCYVHNEDIIFEEDIITQEIP
jgi:N-acetylmuramoyl-L-alanine amidase